MLNTLLILVIALMMAISTGICVFLLLKLRSFSEEIRNFCTSPDEKTPSQLANTVSVFANVISQAVMLQAKTFFMGKASGEARLERGIEADIAQDSLANGAPLIAGVLDMFPSLKKRALKNPMVLQAILPMLAKFIPGGTGSTTSGIASGNGQAKFKL